MFKKAHDFNRSAHVHKIRFMAKNVLLWKSCPIINFDDFYFFCNKFSFEFHSKIQYGKKYNFTNRLSVVVKNNYRVDECMFYIL